MASIFRATDTRDGRTVAIKIPHPDMEADPILSDRFKRESDIGMRLNHPNVMRVFGGEKHSRVYMVMEWCPGRLCAKFSTKAAFRKSAPSVSQSKFSRLSITSTRTALCTAT